MADPGDMAALRAAEIVLGGTVEVEVASFEDIATVLSARLETNDAPSPAAERRRRFIRTTTSRVCAIWRAALPSFVR